MTYKYGLSPSGLPVGLRPPRGLLFRAPAREAPGGESGLAAVPQKPVGGFVLGFTLWSWTSTGLLRTSLLRRPWGWLHGRTS